jgi:hypothetical protein
VNKFDLLCPRDGCGSVILKNGVAKLIEAASVQVVFIFRLPPRSD